MNSMLLRNDLAIIGAHRYAIALLISGHRSIAKEVIQCSDWSERIDRSARNPMLSRCAPKIVTLGPMSIDVTATLTAGGHIDNFLSMQCRMLMLNRSLL